MSKGDYRNIKDFLAKENYRSAGSIYQNILVKYKFYYNKPKYKHRDMYNAGKRYECLTLFGKLVALIGVIGIYLGVYLLIFFTCLLTFNFKEMFDKENYESEMAEELWHEIFIRLPYSHKTIYNYYSFEIPNTIPFSEYKKYIRYRGHLSKFYTKKSPDEKKIIKKFLYGADYVALKHFGLLNDAWKNKGKYMLNKVKEGY